ncbi:MAG: alpha/beta hydrolase [Desulfobacteraceae bacterium]|jgi:pimeloyl-ACP methyl ester carboxylesterase|nr:alpha/beta hydrolase [Desulfobacteraceae bacterium]
MATLNPQPLNLDKKKIAVPTIRVGDIRMYYREEGAGPPLVMIIGYSANSDWWPPGLVSALAARHRVILVDNRGAGRSEAGRRTITIPQMAADTVGLMDAMDIDRAHIFGISMGGMIAQEIALRHPEHVDRLILGCTGCGKRGALFLPDRARLWWGYLTRPGVRSRRLMTNLLFSQEFLNQNQEVLKDFGRRAQFLPMPLEIQLKQIGAMLCFDSYRRLPRIQAPTLVMTGTRDYMAVPRNADILARRIPGARLVKLDGCGHAFIAEAEEQTGRHMLDFLSE